MKQEMFKEGEPRYVTSGINADLPITYQIILWNTIDNLRDAGQELDYLQVFELSTTEDASGNVIQEVRHFQEVPPYEKKYSLPIKSKEEGIDDKVYVIDDGDHATMLFASEY